MPTDLDSNPVSDPLLWFAAALMGGLVTLLLSLSWSRAGNAQPNTADDAGALISARDDCGGSSAGDGGGCD